MADGKLVFFRPSTGSGKLVFGDAGDAPVVPPVQLQIDTGFAHDRAPPDLQLAAVVRLGVDSGFAHDANPPKLQLLWDANVSRGERVERRSHWQSGLRTVRAAATRWQDAEAYGARTASHWQDGQRTGARTEERFSDTLRLRVSTETRWQDGQALRRMLRADWQETERLRRVLGIHWQDADALRRTLQVRWEENLRLRRVLDSHWQDAAPMRKRLGVRGRDGLPTLRTAAFHWQDAMRPPPGRSRIAPVEPEKEICYDPARLGLLVFDTAFTGDGKLVFVCRKKDGSEQPATIVVPVRRSYIVVNELSLRRVDGDLDLFAQDFDLSLNEADYTWTWSATLRRQAWPRLQELLAAQTVEVEARINGVAYRLLAETMSRDSVFGEQTITVEGRGKAAALDAPHAPVMSFANDAPRTAHQLMLDVLTLNGVSMGWTVDWGLEDWVVPAGAWVHRGSYISAINAIATAAGGYVQPHATGKVLRILHRYPVAPWDWGSVVPQIELPWDVTAVEGVQVANKPAYNFVIVHGETAGRAYEVTRGGTAGDEVADTIVEPLATAAALGRQRGRAVLADTGRQAVLSLSLPVLPATGLIMPGNFLRRTGGGEVWQGYTRSLRLSTTALGALRQTIEVQTHHV